MKEAVDLVWTIWRDGGWLMLPLFLLGVFIYVTLLDTSRFLGDILSRVRETNEWAHWVDRPIESEGLVGDMIQMVQSDQPGPTEIHRRIRSLKQAYVEKATSQIRLSVVLVSTAPLAGLLGTVTGMLSTFAGLAGGTGGNTVDLVAGGISEALITTQTGLLLAIPGYALIHLLRRRRDEVDSFLNRLEILCRQTCERRARLSA